MAQKDLRLLIASTEKTGNTWLKLLLSRIYDLPTPYIGHDFSVQEADLLGERWVTHQHFLPEPRLLDWASASNTHLLTTLRHPGDLLVSLYHYCCNYPHEYKADRQMSAAIAADAAERQATATLPHHIVDGELIRALQERVMCDLNISISWMLSRRSIVVRYEDLRIDPTATLRSIAARITPVSEDRIQEGIERCQLHVLRGTLQEDSLFFRRGLIGEWRAVLPRHILRRFRDEEPFRSQFAFLGYDPGFEESGDDRFPEERQMSGLQLHGEHFDNGVSFAPVLRQLLESVETDKRQRWEPLSHASLADSFFQWLNAPADDDPFNGGAIPRITNLAAFIYRIRPDLQAAFPDAFDADRLRYATWFLRYAGYAYHLDRRFLTPIALSWIPVPASAKCTIAEETAVPLCRGSSAT
jgi:Sulfotransferase domain